MSLTEDGIGYKHEMDMIIDYMLSDGRISNIGKFIYDAFRESFGSSFFKCDVSECEMVNPLY